MTCKAAMLTGALVAAILLPSGALARGQAEQAGRTPPVPVAPRQALVATEQAEGQAASTTGWLRNPFAFEPPQRRSLDLGRVTLLKLPHSAVRLQLRLGGVPAPPAPPNLPWQEQALITVHAGITVTHGKGPSKRPK